MIGPQLAAYTPPSHTAPMFTVTEAEAAAIRTAFDQGGGLPRATFGGVKAIIAEDRPEKLEWRTAVVPDSSSLPLQNHDNHRATTNTCGLLAAADWPDSGSHRRMSYASTRQREITEDIDIAVEIRREVPDAA
jgi:hypothetical protein